MNVEDLFKDFEAVRKSAKERQIKFIDSVKEFFRINGRITDNQFNTVKKIIDEIKSINTLFDYTKRKNINSLKRDFWDNLK